MALAHSEDTAQCTLLHHQGGSKNYLGNVTKILKCQHPDLRIQGRSLFKLQSMAPHCGSELALTYWNIHTQLLGGLPVLSGLNPGFWCWTL